MPQLEKDLFQTELKLKDIPQFYISLPTLRMMTPKLHTKEQEKLIELLNGP